MIYIINLYKREIIQEENSNEATRILGLCPPEQNAAVHACASGNLFILFAYIPMAGIVLAFKQYNNTGGIFGSPWNGISNFRFFFESGNAWMVTRNTALYNIAFIIVNNVLQIAVRDSAVRSSGQMVPQADANDAVPALLHFLGCCRCYCI